MLDIKRVLILIALSALLILVSEPIGLLSNIPALSPFFLFSGLTVFGYALTHVVRKILHPYVDMRKLWEKASEESTGAGLVFLALAIIVAASLLAMRPAVAEEVPRNAKTLLPILVQEQQTYWPALTLPSALAAQVEQESNWNPRAELKTSREYGFGLSQITKTARFDNFALLTSKHPALAEWRWDDRFNPRMQLRAMVLLNKDNYSQIKNAKTQADALAFSFSAYNGGLGGLNRDRAMCAAIHGCDKGRWFGHVESTSYRSKIAVKGYGKSFFAINREYVRNVMIVRRTKYEFIDV